MHMKRNVYYGEYTLMYWIDMMLSGKIRLPEYQRFFVWSKSQVQKLIDSIEEDSFVPPITIGMFKKDNRVVNYILDGQQRLTSIFLAYLCLFPKSEKDVKEKLQQFADENDDYVEEDDIYENIQEWTFEKLIKEGKDKKEILEKYNRAFYDDVDYGNSNSFFYKKFLGFNYIVPDVDDENEQQRFYSSVFRNINLQGEKLLPIESRKSLYYLRTDLKDIFEPNLGNIRVNNCKIDFVRYLSLLFQYHLTKKINMVSRGFPYKKAEEYYENFIYSVVEEKTFDMFADFKSVFPNGYSDDLKKMKDYIDLILPKELPSIIDLDLYLFGIIYQILFEKKCIDKSKTDDLIAKLNESIAELKENPQHKKSPSLLKFLRLRLQTSLNIYENYAVAP